MVKKPDPTGLSNTSHVDVVGAWHHVSITRCHDGVVVAGRPIDVVGVWHHVGVVGGWHHVGVVESQRCDSVMGARRRHIGVVEVGVMLVSSSCGAALVLGPGTTTLMS
ncbi:hypothetical protein EDB85DRAFT_1904777 [Lactarius pseudohatsudake]|nr:hypothetical protein EDB85DRAFT_1904777 [Lactarius pseudohatsudake]